MMVYINQLKKVRNLDKYTKLAIIIIIIGFLLRFSLASISYVTGDGCWHFNAIRFIARNFKIPLFEPIGRPVFWPPPFYHIVGGVIYSFFNLFSKSAAELLVKLLNPIFGSLMIFYSFLVSRKLFNSKIAFFSVFFLSFIPDHIYHSTIPFPDVLVGLLTVASVYYILKDKIIVASILAGLAMLTKYNGLFVFPVLVLILFIKHYKEREKLFKKILKLTLISGIIGSTFYIRNWILLGSPVYFGPETSHMVSGFLSNFDFSKLFVISSYFRIYLAFFGVPSGLFQNLFFLKIPFIHIFIGIWLTSTMVFTVPFIFGLSKLKMKKTENKILVAWAIPFLLFLFFMMTLPGDNLFARYLIPIFPVIAILLALGFEKLLGNIKNKKIVFLILILIVIGFLGIEFVKTVVVKNSWEFYKDDFKWVRDNTPGDSIVLVPFGDCYAYNFDRYTYNYHRYEEVRDRDGIKEKGISYIWVNQRNTLYRLGQENESGTYPEEFLDILDDFGLLYRNDKTSTYVYEVK